MMRNFGTLAMLLTLIVLVGAGASGATIVSKCKADLAHRLQLNKREIALVEKQPVTWPDAALGMPEPDKMYAQVLTPGWKIILEARNERYLYTASKKAFRYGGPVSSWASSLLYLAPVPDEPNLNGDLYQCSLVGSNCTLLLSGVSEYHPQAKGMVIAKRRTSRSGHELLLVNADEAGEARTLYSAFDLGAAALNEAGDVWAGFVRPMVGSPWEVVVAHVGQDVEQVLPLPEGVRPGRIAWAGEQLMILVPRGDRTACYQITPAAAAPKWEETPEYNFVGLTSFMLNKSETLEIDQVDANGKPSVEVARVWFTGDRIVKATIEGLTLRGYDLLGAGYAFIWGEMDGKPAAYTVDISTGEIIPSFHGDGSDIKPFEYAPASRP